MLLLKVNYKLSNIFSLIIEDLSKWKTFLCKRVNKLEASLQAVLDENRKNRHLLKSAHEYAKYQIINYWYLSNFIFVLRNLNILKNEFKLEISVKQKPLDSTTIAEDVNRISLLLKKHLLSTQNQEHQIHNAVHQTQAESEAQQVILWI